MNNRLEDELRQHVSDREAWLRFAFLVMFFVIFYLSILLTFATSIFQFLARLFSGSPFKKLSDFGGNLADYQAQVVRYITFSSDEKPFPFAPFPGKSPESNSCVVMPSDKDQSSTPPASGDPSI